MTVVMVFYRRRLPHWQPPEKALFITWRLHGSLPASIPRKRQPPTAKPSNRPEEPGQRGAGLRQARGLSPPGQKPAVAWTTTSQRRVATWPEAGGCLLESDPRHGNDAFLDWDNQLDSAQFGPLWLRDSRVAAIVEKALQEGASKLQLYHLHAYVVMPNHVHLLVGPNAPLERITTALKTFTARRINKILGRTGRQFWQHESFDHWVRNEEEFSRIAAYVEQNPVRAGLVKRPQDWPWSSAHQ